MEEEFESRENQLKIIVKLKTAIQKEVTERFGHGRPTLRGVEEVRKFAQMRLDEYIEGLKKESAMLEEMWRGAHPLIIYCHISLKTRTYAIEITTRDNPKAM